MVELAEIHSLSEFQRNARAHIRRLKKSGKPQVLTVNGRAEIVVLDARAYQRLMESIDEASAVEGIQRGLDSIRRGAGVPLATFDRRMRRKHAIPKA